MQRHRYGARGTTDRAHHRSRRRCRRPSSARASSSPRTSRRNRWLSLLGERKSGAFYSAEDLDLIQTLVNQSALALENARAYEIIKRTQKELVRAERLAAVGELVRRGGARHPQPARRHPRRGAGGARGTRGRRDRARESQRHHRRGRPIGAPRAHPARSSPARSSRRW